MIKSDEADKMLAMYTARLAEHFDTVQIFVSKYEGAEDKTVSTHHGTGNHYARRGQITEWLDNVKFNNEGGYEADWDEGEEHEFNGTE